MMKALLKQLHLALAIFCLTSMAYAQNPTVTFDNVPAGIELTNHIFASGDELVFTIDNIPDTNTSITANIRVYIAGSLANGSKKLQTSFNIDATSSSTGADYTFVESAGTNANTIKRVFTFTSLIPNTGGSGVGGNYVLDEEYDILVRLIGGTPSPDDTNSNTIVPATTMKGIADSVTNDVTITVAQTPTKINPDDGSLDQPLIFTIGNIPTSSGVTINSRSYNSDNAAFNGGGNIGQFPTAIDLDENTADVDNANLKTESTVPSGGLFNRTFTLKKHGLITGATTSDVILAIRFVGGSAFTFDTALTAGTGGNANNNSFALAPSVTIDATLSSKGFNSIAKSIYPNPVSTELTISKSIKSKTYKVINLLGKTVKNVKANGSLDVSDLSSGIYILKTDSGIAKFVKN